MILASLALTGHTPQEGAEKLNKFPDELHTNLKPERAIHPEKRHEHVWKHEWYDDDEGEEEENQGAADAGALAPEMSRDEL